MTIYLEIITSVAREIIPLNIKIHESKEIIPAIVDKLLESGYSSPIEEKLYFESGIKVNDNNILDFIENDVLHITYKDIIAPYGAREYHRENGLVFYFNSNEDNHLHTPHIHVDYNGEKISVFLSDITYKGKFKNKNVLNRALEFIKENCDDMLEKWYIYHPTYKNPPKSFDGFNRKKT